MTDKSKKIVNIIVNVIACVIMAIVLFLTINIIASAKKGYTAIFGVTHVAVETNSMDGDQPDSFKPGDLLTVKILSDEQKAELEVGDIIMFYDYGIYKNRAVLNSHRIVEITENESGALVYTTKGDNPDASVDKVKRTADDIVGKVTKHVAGLGKVTLWFRSSAGFAICVVVPSLLVVAYCVYNLVKVILERRAAAKAEGAETEAEAKERLRRELMEELRAEGKLVDEESKKG